MQLTKLEIKGFKSFGDKITINFDQGITGIVGPNGCGKSNVVDAIRWVLGEQKTKALRSDKMENVIFNGTKNRKPLQMAEVSLSFSNTKNLLPTEYSQVTITRRYYRSGESEYQLNGVTCRLKDITNLFLDTGIASNSYAIIELKMVDDILNDKDNSRRGLFEEAAGISKFKIRKKETLRKLDSTDADLERVEDLLFEIEKNLKSLERQAKQTQRYFKIKEEYKKFSIDLAKKSVGKHKDSLSNLKQQIATETDKKTSYLTQINEKESLIEKTKTDLLNKEKVLSSRQKSLNEHVNKIRQYESDKKVKNERLRFLNDKSDSLKEQIDQDKKSNERAAFSIKGLNQEKESAQKLLLETEHLLESLRQEHESQKSNTAEIQAEVNETNTIYRSRQDQVYQLNKTLEIKQMQLSTLKQEMEKAASDTSEQSANLVEFENKAKELAENLDLKNEQLTKLKASEEDLESRIESSEHTIEVIKDELTENSRKLDALRNEYNLTKSLVDNLEGFPEAIKFLKKKSDWGKKFPLLSDVLTCSQEYRVTIENYLEPYMNYYIVDTFEDAYKAVDLLSDASKGKANFFVLESFEDFHPLAGKIFDNALPATEIVEYESKYGRLISYILDGVYIVAGDHQNIPVDKDSIFITKNAKITRRRHSISGGSVGLFEGKRIGRAKNLEKLSKEIVRLEKKIDKIKESLEQKQKEHTNLKESTKRVQLEDLQHEMNLINEEYISFRTKHEQFQEMLSSNANRREDIQESLEAINDEIHDLVPQVHEENEHLKTLEGRMTELSETLQERTEMLSQKSAEFNQQNILFHQHENKVNSIDQEITFKQTAYESSSERIEKNQAELRYNESEIKRLLQTTESDEDDLLGMYEEKETIENGVNEAEKDYYATRGEVDEIEKSLREIQHQREATDTLLMELQNGLNETKLQLNSIKERLSIEFETDLDEVLKETDDEEQSESELSEEELQQKVTKAKDQLERIGPINPMAMEAYEEIQERHVFITTQKEDLIKAKESLLETISEIDAVAKETFLEAYAKIKENFIKVFRSLFTEEDDCDLTLSNPENPLESSIEIMAKPKGKRPLTINQLSGGEKTLTATSLLFAIYLLKPAPFCIFDEVDAPLDDANIDKFNNIIRKFSEDSQFIIVTHNKRTMSTTDIIYGITMVEQGVSKVVPVDLRELA
ncbi:chromosome segregation protein SMC [Fulvivirgaceae bacterium BMA10]|uniref:Chromosome partition protein Smc n=1 Tax=Splendidivirga corallicola TaxID=3051826 RepID=A0ABT8KXA2_9BACT|nr:chromosome segregation protein SMC [Fulvivirgaceae bacterium BMA10]